MSEYYGTLGEAGSAQAGDITTFLNHSLIPRLGPAQKRSTITTLEQARVYAAAGFHVCVDRGLNERAGSNPRLAWASAAHSYWQAYKATSLSAAMSKLSQADSLAASAPRVVRDAPPINPTPPAPTETKVVPTPGGGTAMVPFQPESPPALMMVAGIPVTMGTVIGAAALGGFLWLSRRGKKGKRGRGGGRRGARGKGRKRAGGRKRRSSGRKKRRR